MDAIRKRIEQDPYEAVFGKRFEPFWRPLFPNWVDEELSMLSGSRSSVKETSVSASRPSDRAQDAVGSDRKTDVALGRDAATAAQKQTGPPFEKSVQAYAMINKTSWDSWSNKARREEWDSATGQTRHYEYDPISNRMVLLQPTTSAVASSSDTRTSAPNALLQVEAWPEQASAASTWTTVHKDDNASEKPRLAIPVPTQNSSSLQHTPTVDNPSLLNNSTAEVTTYPSTAPPLPSSPTKTTISSRLGPFSPLAFASPPPTRSIAQRDSEYLTSHDARASMGKERAERGLSNSSAAASPRMETVKSEWEKSGLQIELDRELDMLMRKKAKILMRLRDGPLTERQRQDLQNLEHKFRDVSDEIFCLGATLESRQLRTCEPGRKLDLEHLSTTTGLAPNDTCLTPLPTASAMSPSTLQPSIDRLHLKSPVNPSKTIDSAAHDGQIKTTGQTTSHVPKNWTAQTDVLQDSRIARTRDFSGRATEIALGARMQEEAGHKHGDEYVSNPTHRWVDEANRIGKEAHQRALAEEAASEALADAKQGIQMAEAQATEQERQNGHVDALHNRRAPHTQGFKEKAQNFTTEQVGRSKEVPSLNQPSAESTLSMATAKSHMERYRVKYEELRAGLDTSFKQSSIQAGAHLERINALGAELAQARTATSSQAQSVDRRYRDKIRELREQLDQAFKQSSVQAKSHVERIQALEKALKQVSEQTKAADQKAEPIEEVRGEGDVCTYVAKFSKDGDRWCKQPVRPISPVQASPEQYPMPDAGHDGKDISLINELKQIYQTRYGVIDVNHRQGTDMPKNRATHFDAPYMDDVELGFDSGLGKALSDFDKGSKYRFQDRNLETEIAAQEKAADELEQELASTYKYYDVHEDGPQLRPADQSAQVDHDLRFAASGGRRPFTYLAEPSTGSFASPTGYVGDHWGHEKPKQAPAHPESESFSGKEFQHPQRTRVHRQEPVYSESRLGQQKARRLRRHHSEAMEEQAQRRRQRRRAFRSRVRWALSVGLGSAAIVYTVGAIAERKEHAQAERWQQILEGNKARWE